MDAVQPRFRRSSGLSRLVEHCEPPRNDTGAESASARSRLERELGPELTRRLVDALVGPRGRPLVLL